MLNAGMDFPELFKPGRRKSLFSMRWMRGEHERREKGGFMSSTNAFIEAIADAVMNRLQGAGVLSGAPGVRPRLLTMEGAGEYLSRSADSIRGLIRSGRLPTVRIDNRVFLDVKDLDRVIENSKASE
jgi:hypothetical protein